ncbi:MAG: hypothetical protein ACFFAN_03205 [Promethearchaeota archaeon]
MIKFDATVLRSPLSEIPVDKTSRHFKIWWSKFDRIEVFDDRYQYDIKLGGLLIESLKPMKVIRFLNVQEGESLKEQEFKVLELKSHLVSKRIVKFIVQELKRSAEIKNKQFIEKVNLKPNF